MMKIVSFLAVLTGMASTQMVSGQHTEGVITYEIKINMHRNLPEEREHMKSMIPEFRISDAQLLFDPNESLFKPVANNPVADQDNGAGARMRTHRAPRNEIYIKPAESKRIMLQEFMGKKYLIEDSLRMQAWKLGTELKDINGYRCRQATFYDEERKWQITAWYTDAFRPFLGPENFNTLPGAVLLLDINNGERMISAKHIVLRPLQENEIKIPTAGKAITADEYHTLMKGKTERMRANGGNMIIRH